MSLGKVTRKAISIVLLAAMTTSSLSSQASTIPLVQEGVFDAITYTNGDMGNSQNTEAENSAPDAEAQSEGSESVSNEEAEAESNSGAENNSENASAAGTQTGTTSSRTLSGYAGENSSYENYESTESVTVEDENPLTSGNRTSGFISLDKQAIGFTKVGDVVSVTATTADDVKDKVVWRVADPERLRVRTSEQEGNASTAQIEWIGESDADQTTSNFFAALESNPDEYAEGTAMLFSSNQPSTDQSEQTENKELKTSFESPEVEEFLKEMYAEGLSQENSDYDLSKLFDDSADKTYTPYTDDTDDIASETNSALAVTQEESSYFELLSKNELSDTELINNLTESNDETEASEADKTAWEDENDRVSSYLNSDTEEGAEATSGNSGEEVTVNAADTASESTQQAASTPAQETPASSTTTTPAAKTTTVKETVKDVDTENVSRETTKTETVTTEIVDSETTYETVTKEVETKVPTTVTTEQEQVIETEVFNDEGEMETVTETISVPTTETVYETVTETVTEEVPVKTEYSVKETIVVSTVVTETVTNKYGEVISKKVISSDESSSSRDYVTTNEPSEGTTTNVTTSNDSETVEKVTEREVEKTVTTEVPT